MPTSPVTVLDCTLRDGGYYNDWDFDTDLVESYVEQLALGGVDIIELGFRFTDKSKFYGPFAHTSEDFLATLNLPKGPTYGVMINASDYLTDRAEEDMSLNFVPAEKSLISLVRIAAHLRQVPQCGPMIARLKSLGYLVGLNIMQISQADDATIRSLVETIEKEFVEFEALYFADSLGNMRPDDIRRVVGLIRAATGKSIGFHGHDNISLGVSNSLTAIESGATWIDATITGMGRGAGNTQMEYLSTELKNRGLADLKCMHIHEAATGRFSRMQAEYGWGTNLFYYEAGLQAVHPTYVQQMIQSKRFEPLDILTMIGQLGKSDKNLSYSDANIESAFAGFLHEAQGRDDMAGKWTGRQVVLVAAGPNAKRHWPAIKDYAERNQALVLSVNANDFVSPDDLDGAICVHPARLLSFFRMKSWANVPLYTSRPALPGDILDRVVNERPFIDYGVCVESGRFEPLGNGCYIPAPVAAAVALALAIDAEASKVFLAGFDGFDGKSREFDEMQAILNQAQALGCDISSLTQTHFNVPMKSLYGTA